MSIHIIAKRGSKAEVVDEASNGKQARQQVSRWQGLKGKGWKVFSKVAK